jgi:CheY-like chemotaxis protein
MSGTVGVNSVFGKGSHFWFRVALASVLDAPSEETPAIRSAPPVVQKLKILLVDDNATNQIVASRMLTSAGHEVETAGNGKEALAAASVRLYDVIFMDISMPEMDGIEATRKIRELAEPFRSVWIIALTANAIAGDRERFLAAGMNDYLTKPMRRADIEARLGAVVAVKADRAAEPPTTASAAGGDHQAPLLDPTELATLGAETSPDVVVLVVDEYLSEMKRRLEEALAAMQAKSLEDLKKVTHAIAGASASTGARRLRDLCKHIEVDCVAGNGGEAFDLANELPRVMQMTDAAFREHLAAATIGKAAA